MRVTRLPPNLLGRDFIIGDLHGHYDTLMSLLDARDFDREIDRVISVGDLVDRGPQSWLCLQLIREPWFYVVQGNHESHLLDMARAVSGALAKGRKAVDILDSLQRFIDGVDGHWFREWLLDEGNHAELPALIELLDSLPHVITVRGGATDYNVVHAELPAAGIECDDQLESSDPAMDVVRTQALMWSRKLFLEASKAPREQLESHRYVPKGCLSLTFCGHNPISLPTIWRDHFFLDTGCGYQDGEIPVLDDQIGLTVCILPKRELVLVQYRQGFAITLPHAV
jgi:serine/threonine protein phosphatase 1